jgi:hypothetical protein
MIQLGHVTLRFVEAGSEFSTTQRVEAPRTAGTKGPTDAEQVLDQLAFGVVLLSSTGPSPSPTARRARDHRAGRRSDPRSRRSPGY